MKRTGPTNVLTQTLVSELKKQASLNKAAVWKRVADELQRPTRQRRIVNLSRINRYAKDGETIVVLGKVLGAGTLQRNVNVAALTFSENARQQILAAKGKPLSIAEVLTQNPKGSNVRIIG